MREYVALKDIYLTDTTPLNFDEEVNKGTFKVIEPWMKGQQRKVIIKKGASIMLDPEQKYVEKLKRFKTLKLI